MLLQKEKHPINAMVARVNDDAVGRIESVQFTMAKGEDFERLCCLIDVQTKRCSTCHAPLWRRVFLFPYYLIHRWRCKHERLWREKAARKIRSISIGGSIAGRKGLSNTVGYRTIECNTK